MSSALKLVWRHEMALAQPRGVAAAALGMARKAAAAYAHGWRMSRLGVIAARSEICHKRLVFNGALGISALARHRGENGGGGGGEIVCGALGVSAALGNVSAAWRSASASRHQRRLAVSAAAWRSGGGTLQLVTSCARLVLARIGARQPRRGIIARRSSAPA